MNRYLNQSDQTSDCPELLKGHFAEHTGIEGDCFLKNESLDSLTPKSQLKEGLNLK